MAYSEDVNVNLNVLTGTMSGITAIMGGMSALTSSFGAMGTAAADSFGALDGLLVSATALITTFAVQSAEAFGQYEQGMKIVQTVSGQTSYAMTELANKANDMSIAYRTSINDINDGLQTLGRAGLNSVNEQLEVLESGLQTAKLEGRNLNGVLEELIQNTAMLGGDLKSVNFGEQTEYLNTIMVGTSMTAPITSHDISQTLQYAGGTAAAAGANLENKDKLEDLMGTIAAFAQKGVKGSMSGTALRAFFTKPASQDTSVTDALASIGLSPEDLWEDGGESMKKVSDQVGIIKNRMDTLNMSTMDQVELWGKIVGPKMGQQMMKLDSSSIKDLTRDIQSASSAEELATQTLHTYTQKLAEMSEQGSLAYREFGEKVAMFLSPVVDVITKILGVLSDPHVNFIAFAAVGSLLAHGFRTAWTMITSIFAQIRGLLAETQMAIQTINGSAGGSASGFAKSASEVDFLNSKLAQTNKELALMQAQFMKIGVSKTGSSVLPLGMVGHNGKLPHNMIDYSNRDVLNMTAPNGQSYFYDQSEDRQFRKDYVAHLKQGVKDDVDKAVSKHYDESTQRYRKDISSKGVPVGQFIKKSALEEQYNKQFGLSDKDIAAKTDAALKQAKGELHSGFFSMTKKEFGTWMRDLRQASIRLGDETNYKKGGLYVDKKGNYTQAYHDDVLKDFNRQRQRELMKNAHYEGNIHKSNVDGRSFVRGEKLYRIQNREYGTERLMQKEPNFKQFEKKWAQTMNQQQAAAYGSTSGIANKVQQATEASMQKLNKSTMTMSQRFSAFGTKIQSVTGTLQIGSERVQNSITNAMRILETEVKEGGMTFEEALIRLSELTGLTAEELTVYSHEFKGALFEMSGGLSEAGRKLASFGLVTADGTKATISNTAELIENSAATKMNTSSKIGETAKNTLSTVVNYMGGPFMAALMGFTFITQQINEQQQKWQEQMQEASNQLSEAKDTMTQSSDKLKEIYEAEYPNMSEADTEKIADYQYAAITQAYDEKGNKAKFSDMYDNEVVKVENLSWTKEEREENHVKTAEELQELNDKAETITLTEEENIKALENNTASLKSATYQYAQALQKIVNAGNNSIWGFKGVATEFSEGNYGIPGLNDGGGIGIYNRIKDYFIFKDNGFLDNNSPVLSASQSDKNYGFGTDFASIFIANSNRFDVEQGLQKFFGNDYDRIIGIMGGINNKVGIQTKYGNITGPSNLFAQYGSYFNTLPSSDAAMAMAFMKDNPDEMSKLAKQIFRQEQQYDFAPGVTAAKNYNAIASGYHPDGKPLQLSKSKTTGTALGSKDLKKITSNISKAKLTTQDKNLKATVDKFRQMTGYKLDAQTILMMGNLQMLADMNKVANEQIAPGVTQTVQTAGQIMDGTYSAAGYAGSAADGAGGAAANAYAIAVFLQAQAQETSMHGQYQQYTRNPDAEKQILGFQVPSWMPGGQLYGENDFNNEISQVGSDMYNKYGKSALENAAAARYMLQHPDASIDEVKAYGEKSRKEVEQLAKTNGSNFQDMMNTVTRGMPEVLQQQLMSAYDQSDIGEYGGNNGGVGGGSGGGGDGGDSGSRDQGSTTNRVDLVLCNKKTIPKLNVNLFKKPPQFTIKNKQFSVRDININTQDKPDAMVDAVKDSIIRTQERMDPKIVQDEQAVYDPVAATDGTTPKSGTPVTSK